MNATLAEYAARGWSLKPVLAGQKRPATKGWPDREFGPADFADGMNIAIRLGKHSRDLVDCDVDCEEAIELAPLYLPETWAIFGRSSAPRSHWLYFAPEAQFEAFVASLVNQALGELGALLI